MKEWEPAVKEKTENCKGDHANERKSKWRQSKFEANAFQTVTDFPGGIDEQNNEPCKKSVMISIASQMSSGRNDKQKTNKQQ